MSNPAAVLQDFASLVATLSDPFARRPATLAAHGLDEAGLAEITAAWTQRIVGDAGLRARYSDAFKAERERRIEVHAADVVPAIGAVVVDGARDVSLHAPAGPAPRLAAPPAVGDAPSAAHMPDPLDTTGEVMTRVAPVVPFVEHDALGIPIAVATAAARAVHVDTGTVELRRDTPASGPATPFEGPGRPPSAKSPAAASSAAVDDDDLDRTTEFRLPLGSRPKGAG